MQCLAAKQLPHLLLLVTSPVLLPAEPLGAMYLFSSLFVRRVGEGISRHGDTARSDSLDAITSFSITFFSVHLLIMCQPSWP